MITKILQGRKALSDCIINKSITQKRLALIFVILFVISLIPLLVIALYNYPADDDFAFIYPVSSAWVNTHSFSDVVKVIVDGVKNEYLTWNGYFSHFVYLRVSPLIFGIQYYFISNWFVLAMVCLSIAYAVRSIVIQQLKASKSVFYLAYVAIMVMVIQYMPSISEGVYWNSGASYVVTWCYIMFSYGMLIKCSLPQTLFQKIFRGLLLIFCGFYLGGGVLPVALSAWLLFLFYMTFHISRKAPNRLYAVLLFCTISIALFLSIIAPGNALRQELFGESQGVFRTIVTSILESCDLVGRWFSLQLIAMLMIILPVLWMPMKKSTLKFKHPFLVALALFAVFSSTLAPGIYTNFGYTSNRYINPVYFNFLIFVFCSVIYAQGAVIRLLERKQEEIAPKGLIIATQNIGKRFSILYLMICLVVLMFGSFGNTIMNTSSVSAAKSLVTGEAATFRNEMSERQEYIRVTDSDIVAVSPIHTKPYVFKDDKLAWQGIYGTVRYMKWYFELYYKPESAE
jgi:hypothetical protein